jgi:hypothetical protein
MAKNKKDYSEASWKLDKFMPDDSEVQDEYYRFLDDNDVDGLAEFIEMHCEEERMYNYFPKGGTVLEFAEYLIKENKRSINE